MSIRAVLYDATGQDREVDLLDDEVKVDKDRLLWIDIDGRDPADLVRAGAAIGLDGTSLRRLSKVEGRARLLRLPDRIVLTLGTVEPDDPEAARHELDIVIGANHIVTVHDRPIWAVDEFRKEIDLEELVGRLDSASFVAGLVDSIFTAYFRQVEAIERDIDELDVVAVRNRADASFLSTVVVLRRRIARLRRALAPNREALLPLERPDVAHTSDLGTVWPGISQRLERAIDGVENARELLVGSFDLYLGRSSQRTNDVMKILTLVSAIALPGIVLAGVMGMNFQMPFFDDANNFFVVAGAMAAFAIAILVIARWRSWI
ncbi:MAG TPA: CorA family divalent cation transporter [Patescibacteria group bacterium]|nr:CorA family divalent cation transporter [Patescibacteria group bacterium]